VQLTKEQVAEWTTYQEEQGEKPDPNNIYFIDKIVGGVVPGEYIPSVEAGFREATVKGAKYGFQCVDIQATLLDGKYHEVDSSQDAFKLAAMECTRDAQVKAGITLLEPIMNVVVLAPSQYLGDLTRDISRRRGEILNLQHGKGPLPIARLRSAGRTVRLHQRTAQLHERHGVVRHGAEPLCPGEGRIGRSARGQLTTKPSENVDCGESLIIPVRGISQVFAERPGSPYRRKAKNG
jgi:hypothetical protein